MFDTAAVAPTPTPDDRADAAARRHVLALTARIVSAHLGHNPVAPEGPPELIRAVHRALGDAARGGGTSPSSPAEPARPRREPAVPVKRSVGREWVACLECGARMVMLKRHLAGEHGLTPDSYRERWGLGRGYPLVAPAYAETRSDLAKQAGLGQRRSDPPPEGAAPSAPAKAGPAAAEERLSAGTARRPPVAPHRHRTRRRPPHRGAAAGGAERTSRGEGAG